MKHRIMSVLSAAVLAAGVLGVSAPSASAVPGGCAYASSTYRPTIQYGSTGVAVKQAQCLSNVWGGVPKLNVDGIFGSGTRTKIKWIQGCHGLTKDGIIGAKTWNVLYNPALDCYDPYPG
ncbi:peptidoglycan-binding domain-containing protein [Streptomyces sp. Wh19]|uniref:peptidoglycan-binding domain-containing protein n=1 Tax=Streptomyces sp. Wh19 TaxID=3076629 RepID=UPI0029589424|nr:peptidoglycan-binding domain-containing protein [Streptomyces sp. Wh19]MDV9197429.1 peptidoglycan-binding domain-containing protein [Streptomyces sp. Wh19]